MSLIPTYISYIIAASLAVFSKNMLSDGIHEGIFFDIISVLSFKNGYSWYMEMFFGLALLIPFVNISYNNIKEKSHKLILIAILLFLTGVCSLDLKFNYNGNTYFLLSDYWVILYPFTYYLIGAYISEYRPKINKLLGTASLVILIAAETLYTYLRCKDEFFKWSLLGGEGGFTVAVCAVILFLILYDVNIKNRFFGKLITEISSKTLDIYMISYIFDLLFYRLLLKVTPDFLSRVKFAPVMVVSVFAAGCFYSKLKEYVFEFVKLIWGKIRSERTAEVADNEVKANI